LNLTHKGFGQNVLDSYKKPVVRYLVAMQLTKSPEVFSRVSWFEEIDSTNLELERQLAQKTEDFSAVIASSQTRGQGRLGRKWQSPAGSSLALSVYLQGPHPELGWITLLTALALKRALAKLGIVAAGIKWPNDVLVKGRKISGILAQLIPTGVIVGIGLNLGRQHPELNAISLAELGIELDADQAAAAIGFELKALLKEFQASPLLVKAAFSEACLTLNQNVRAELPGGGEIFGLASEIDDAGQLVILTPEPKHLSAADVWHLRT
jgi:BirA family transcriptional regulator, biotin operon repressor / biotin---[acetyl-CoA-carboxylase] ligase